VVELADGRVELSGRKAGLELRWRNPSQAEPVRSPATIVVDVMLDDRELARRLSNRC
jgi:hypothetical protein